MMMYMMVVTVVGGELQIKLYLPQRFKGLGGWATNALSTIEQLCEWHLTESGLPVGGFVSRNDRTVQIQVQAHTNF